MAELFIFFLIALIGLSFIVKSIRIIGQHERGLVIRLGKYTRTATPGLVFLVPFMEAIIKIDMREQVINVDPQKVITRDNVTVIVDGVVYYKITDPAKSVFEISNFGVACTTLAQTNLRNLIGEKTLDETLTARDVINTNLREVLDDATNAWGVKITRVELQKIDPPADITEAMSRQMKAERDRRAIILEAEGIKRSRVLEAEGIKLSQILKAEGEAKSVLINAEAEAKAIEQVSTAAEKYFMDRAEAVKKLDVINEVLRDKVKLVIPSDSNLINVLGLDSDSKIIPTDLDPKS